MPQGVPQKASGSHNEYAGENAIGENARDHVSRLKVSHRIKYDHKYHWSSQQIDNGTSSYRQDESAQSQREQYGVHKPRASLDYKNPRIQAEEPQHANVLPLTSELLKARIIEMDLGKPPVGLEQQHPWQSPHHLADVE